MKLKKSFQKHLDWFLKHAITVFSSVAIIVLGIVILAHANSVTTTIGENISTNNLTATGLTVNGNATTTGNLNVSGNTSLATTTLSGDLDLDGNELKNSVLEKLADFPSSPVEGQMFYSTASSTPYWYTGSRWKGDVSGATFVVAASDSLNKENADYVCDGTADDVQIQEAIDALPSGGGKVQLLEGTYNVVASIKVSSNVSLIGSGSNTIIKLANGAGSGSDEVHVITNSDYTNGNTNIKIADLSVDGNYANQNWGDTDIGGCGIALNYANDSVVENVYIHDCWRHGLWYLNGSGFIAQNVFSEIVGSSNISIGGQAHYQRFTENVNISNCVLKTSRNNIGRPTTGNSGIEVNDHIHNVNISNCIAYDNDDDGFRVITHSGGEEHQEVSGVNFSNCIAFDNNYGFYVNSPGLYNISDITVSNCIAYNNYGGIRISSDSSGTVQGISVQNSISRNNTSYGIIIVGSSTKDVLISNNIVKDNEGEGIYIPSGASRVKVIGNQVYASSGSSMVHLRGLRTDASNNEILNNTFMGGTKLGILLEDASSNNIIENNTCTDNAEYGIRENAGAHDNIIRYNDVQGNTLGGMVISGTNTVIEKNIGYTTATSSTATITSGHTYVDVTHGLDITPSVKDISVTPTNSLGSASKFWISNINATTFRINVDADPGADATFSWNIGSY